MAKEWLITQTGISRIRMLTGAVRSKVLIVEYPNALTNVGRKFVNEATAWRHI